MRVAYVGNFGPPYSTENDVRKAFEHLGHEVIQLQENVTDPATIWGTMKSADLLLITSTWDEALPLVDMVDVFQWCAKNNKPTATLHLDTFWGTSRGNRQWWRNPMFHTAYIFTADGDYQDEWKRFGKNHIWLPPAVRHDATTPGTFQEKYACDVAFVGSNGVGYHEDVWMYRKELVNFLRDMCARNGWSFKNPGGDQEKIDRDHNMNDFYRSSKVTVGDSLCLPKEKSHYWSDRVPEATGRGGFLIMPQIDAVREMYDDMIPWYRWGDFGGLESLIKYFLEDDAKRETVRDYCHKKTAEHHTYVNRAQQILETVF